MKSMSTDTSQEAFEDLIQNEILKSEKFRGLLLSGIIVVMLLAIVVNSYYLKVFESNLIKPFQWFIVILLGLLIRSVLVRKFQVIWFKKSRRRYLSFLYGNTFFETSIPSVVIIVFASQYNPATALISPIVFFYFLFIILSIFDLDLKLSMFAGFVASAEYLILSLIYYDQYTFSGDLVILNMPSLYVAKSLFLLLAGLVAGIVSLKIRKNFFSSFHTLDERNQLERVFGQQVSKEIVDEFIKNKHEIKSIMRDATVMFLDIQILGDGFMATFGAPVEDENHTLNAVSAAKEIIEVLKSKNSKDEIPTTNVRVGIHCGEVVTGNVGPEHRKQYSVTGNTVILAARLEQLNKEFNSSVIVSKDVIDNMKTEGVEFISLGNVTVKGFANPIEVYRLL